MPTLLQINTVVNSGSTGHIAEEIGELAINKGWGSYIAYGRNPRQSKSQLIRIGSDLDVNLHAIETRLLDNHGLASCNATRIFIKEIDKIKPDIVHLHNIHGYYLNYKILFEYLSEREIPVVWTLHDCWAYTGHCAHYTYAKCDRWQDVCHHCPQKQVYPASMWADRSTKNFLNKRNSFTSVRNVTLVPVSKWLTHEVEKSFLKDYPIRTIYNGIDTTLFVPSPNVKRKYNLENKFLILGVSSVWDNRKGLEDFKTLAAQLKADERIMLVGLTKKQIKELPFNIIGIERTENLNQLVELYSSADLYISFSMEETFGMTIAESMACGTPALVYNSTACPEVVSEETGFVVEPHDMNAVREAINVLKNSTQDYKQQCRDRVLAHFDKGKQWENYIHLYNTLI
ncbi:glycosyltransferase [Bacteroides sp. 214]|uniref:glycosyltransferase n=1 Tax=Bacteroides sp. 214 TaxID=2302935 RepID=UPI0013D6129F|nr:glycosyltransferase [Bacteroides sp. 214]NDW11792.1 glycosyltransferase [Bacteroides sp. 214]